MRNTINFSWNSVEGVSGYNLYRNDSLILTTKDFSYLDDSLEFDKDFQNFFENARDKSNN